MHRTECWVLSASIASIPLVANYTIFWTPKDCVQQQLSPRNPPTGPGDIHEARTPSSLTMCSSREETFLEYAMLAFTSQAPSNQIMHPCKSSFASPEICRNKPFQVANSPAASCLETQKLPALSDSKFLLILAYRLHHSRQESMEGHTLT